MPLLEKIIILDFGSQYTYLIARRIREMQVLSEIRSPSTSFEELMSLSPKGFILSGGPNSVHENKLSCDAKLFQSCLPLLGICYGMQLLNQFNQGTVKPIGKGEYGNQKIKITSSSPLFKGIDKEEIVWMSHGDSIKVLGTGLHSIAHSQDGLVAAIQHKDFPHYGVQFHPEVTHTKKGTQILDNFLSLCGCSRSWTLDHYLNTSLKEIQQKVGNGRVISLVSGGIDSTAATFLCYKALSPENVCPIHIDTGLMRADESLQVKNMLESGGMKNLIFVDASKFFLKALKGVVDPETKRKIIGNLFIDILEEEIHKLDQSHKKTFICQGTLYTDLIESGKGCGQHAAVIKTHHNVSPPTVEKKRQQGLIIEPNAHLFKDEVRRLCEMLPIPNHLIWRHPFPGPGLAIRILGEVTQEKLETLRVADRIFIEELHKAQWYDKTWQAFAVLLPITSVGVMGDKRTEGDVIALRAVASTDGMTAEFSLLPFELLGRVSTRIINEIPKINRVVYDITSKPPATIEWL